MTAEDVERIKVKSPPKRGRSKKKVVEEEPSSIETSLVEKKSATKKPAVKRQTKSKKQLKEEATATPEVLDEGETRRLSTRLSNIEILEKTEVLASKPEDKQAAKKGRGRKPKAQLPDSKTEDEEDPQVESEKEVEESPVISRGRPKRVAKKKFDTLAGFADRYQAGFLLLI